MSYQFLKANGLPAKLENAEPYNLLKCIYYSDTGKYDNFIGYPAGNYQVKYAKIGSNHEIFATINSYMGASIAYTAGYDQSNNRYSNWTESVNGVSGNLFYDYSEIGTSWQSEYYYDTLEEALADMDDGNWSGEISDLYPITYHYTNSTVSGPSEAAVGDTVTVSAVPDVGYGITDASTQILVTNNDVAVPYTWDAANQRITFTMPDPS